MTDIITRRLIPENDRINAVGDRFGLQYPLTVEPIIYTIAEKLTGGQYQGGYWLFYSLSNGGFYQAPAGERAYQISCDNYFEGELSPDALGIAVCIYAFSRLSFSEDRVFGSVMADHYHALRDYCFHHPEAAAILSAID